MEQYSLAYDRLANYRQRQLARTTAGETAPASFAPALVLAGSMAVLLIAGFVALYERRAERMTFQLHRFQARNSNLIFFRLRQDV